ncbi:hypothetical protein L2E82_17005 [Cichorium intybus]|uniref:Uncharacterized protein n=1 Tax=Cichorium intybus TaxID=13427 RepID=A0ACB9F7J6_CICIN|nr:hypothetical protein L2E82_17005 [Cichorium intybus]
MAVIMDQKDSDVASVKDENIQDDNNASLVDGDSIDRKSSGSRNSEGDIAMDIQEDSIVAPKKDIKGVEAIHALKIANNPRKRPKIDHQKEAMLGKKRSRQTMFLNLEDVKQAGTIKTTTPRRQNFPPPVTTRIVKESRLLLPYVLER